MCVCVCVYVCVCMCGVLLIITDYHEKIFIYSKSSSIIFQMVDLLKAIIFNSTLIKILEMNVCYPLPSKLTSNTIFHTQRDPSGFH